MVNRFEVDNLINSGRLMSIEDGKVESDDRYWSLAFTGHTNIEKCYGEKQIPDGFSYNTNCIGGIGNDSANKLYTQIKKAIIKFIESNNVINGVTFETMLIPDGGLDKWNEVSGPAKLNKKVRVIIGMARGVDEIAGIVAMDMGLDIVCCVPHSIMWHANRVPTNKGIVQALFYDRFLKYDKAFWFEIKKNYSSGWPFANFARNAFMVDLADKVLSFKCYDSSGTDHCIKLAKKVNKYAGNISKE